MSKKFRLDRKIGFQNMFYTKCTNVIIDSIGPSIILRSIYVKVIYFGIFEKTLHTSYTHTNDHGSMSSTCSSKVMNMQTKM